MNELTPCFPFGGGKRKSGYGYAQFQGRQFLAHRLAYALNELVHPDALKGVVIRHKCDNPSCVNVEHLEPGTTQDNTDDKVSRGRHLFGERIHQAKLSEADVTAIRQAYRPYSRDANQHTLAKRFGVSQAAVSLILSGTNWKHIK